MMMMLLLFIREEDILYIRSKVFRRHPPHRRQRHRAEHHQFEQGQEPIKAEAFESFQNVLLRRARDADGGDRASAQTREQRRRFRTMITHHHRRCRQSPSSSSSSSPSSVVQSATITTMMILEVHLIVFQISTFLKESSSSSSNHQKISSSSSLLSRRWCRYSCRQRWRRLTLSLSQRFTQKKNKWRITSPVFCFWVLIFFHIIYYAHFYTKLTPSRS